MKVLSVFILLFVSSLALILGIDIIIGKTFWESIFGFLTSFGVMKRGELPFLILFLLLNFLPPYMNYRKNKKTY